MSLLSTLKIKADTPLHLIGAPEHVIEELGSLHPVTSLPRTQKVTQLVFFVLNKTTLEDKFVAISRLLTDNCLLWIAYPKKSGSIRSDLSRDEGWDAVFQSGWRAVASISVDGDWSALRFRHISTINTRGRVVPLGERDTEGVDYVHRTVTLPADVLQALHAYPGLDSFFYALSFTHKREYLEAIAEAKKPETRQRRIEKTVDMLLKLKEQKNTLKRKQ